MTVSSFYDQQALLLSVFVSLYVAALVFIYLKAYDKTRTPQQRAVFCVQVFVAVLAATYMISYIVASRPNPMDHIYKTEPNF